MPQVTLARTLVAATALSGVGLVTLAPSQANAQNTASPSARIDRIEREMRAMQDELRRVKADLAIKDQQLKAAQEQAQHAQDEARQTRTDVGQTQAQIQAQARQAIEAAQADQPKLTFPGGRPTLSSGDGRASLAVGVQLHFDVGTYFQQGRSGTDNRGVKDLNSGENLRRGRIFLVGKYDDWTVGITPDFGGSPDGVTNSQYLFEAYVNYSGLKPLTFTLGYFTPPLTLTDSESTNDFLFLERPSIVEIARNLAAGDARASFGAKANGNRWFAAGYLTGSQYGAQNASLLNDQQTGGTLRVAGRPIAGPDWNVHVGFSGSMAFHPNESASGIPGVSRTTLQLRDRPELRIDQNRLIDTGALSSSGADEYGPELAVQYKSVLIRGEYLHIDLDQVRQPGLLAPSLGFDGGYAEASWVITGEHRPYLPARGGFGSPVPARPLSLADGGIGAFELVGRYSVADLDDHVRAGVAQTVTGGVFGGRQQVYSVGLNWYPDEHFRFMLDYYFVDVNRLDPTGATQIGQRYQAIAARVQAAF
jgi:phosphate-selective porin OprO/OprP